jgi:hypothetical protein
MKEQSAASNLKSGLHERLDPGLYEPMRDEWFDLIEKLNERERKEADAQQHQQKTECR